jgi:alkyldihydroxyacetonephosphate synthase
MSTTEITEALQRAVGPENVSVSETDRDAHSHDSWPVASVWAKLGRHPHRPDVVVHVKDANEIAAVVNIASNGQIPVTAWGLGSSVTGQPLPVRGGILLDLSKLVGEPVLDEINHLVTAPAGVRGSDLEAWLNGRGFTLNFSPQSLFRSTIGGWVATRATGQFSSRYGGIENALLGYDAVLADGSIVSLGQRPRAAMGPDLKQILIGSEGTFGVVTSVTLKVYRPAQKRLTDAFELDDLESGLTIMREIAQVGLRPFLVRLYDADEAAHVVQNQPSPVPVLFLGFEGEAAVADAERSIATAIAEGHGARNIGSDPVEAWLGRRFDFSTVENLLATPGGYAETVEVANLWGALPEMYAELKTALAPLADEVLGHFSHIYEQGSSLYIILLGRADTDELALAKLETIWATAMEVVLAHDGEISHHHGGGLARQAWVRRSLGSGFRVLERIKLAMDPKSILNPGKLGM